MKKYIDNIFGQKGSMMVEALAMLGLITMVTPILYKKAAERTSELQDINTANQMRTISKALDDYIKDNYLKFSDPSVGVNAAINAEEIEPYLPYGFSFDDSRLLGDYQIAIRKGTAGTGAYERSTITGIVVAKPKNDLPMIRSSKIASMIGANGGVVNDTAINGVGGGWLANDADFGFSTAGVKGGLAVTSSHAVMSDGGGVNEEEVLFRKKHNDALKYNTMGTDLYLGGYSIFDINKIITETEEVKQSLKVGGDTTLEGTLSVGKATSLKDTLTVAAGKATTLGGSLTVAADQLTTLGGDLSVRDVLDVTASGATFKKGAVTVNDGVPTTLNDTLTVNKATTLNDALTVKDGKATVLGGTLQVKQASNLDGATTVGTNDSATDEMLLVKGNARITQDLTVGKDLNVTGNLIAPNIFGKTSLAGGGTGTNSDNYNFVAKNNDVVVRYEKFSVAGERLKVDPTESSMKKGNYSASVKADGAAIGSSSNKLALTDTSATLTGTDTVKIEATNTGTGLGNILLSANDTLSGTAKTVSLDGSTKFSAEGGSSKIELDSAAYIGYGNTSYFEADSSSARIVAPNGHRVDVASTGVITNKGTQLKFNNASDTNLLYVDENELIMASGASGIEDSSTDTIKRDVTEKGVILRREGAIFLPQASNATGREKLPSTSGKQDIAGYIKADRFIANQKFIDPKLTTGDNISADEPGTNKYDAYQLNPAYTSVMHDIKLTTRGGARLSDILPDFINRGIYVLDNTFKETKDSPKDWSQFEVKPGNSGNAPIVDYGNGKTSQSTDMDCSDADCAASPWLGFIPLAQCPPGYDKVVTINPIRWKMSEAYYVTGATNSSVDVTQQFRNYFIPPTNPATAKFTLSEEDGATGTHTHHLSDGGALTFQTNTWLNTTVSKATDSDGDVVGWHAIMGFLYYGDWYSEYLSARGVSGYSGKIFWNLFPVYFQEMSAIANVYCYFGRDGGRLSKRWNSNLVYEYDQLTNYRTGYGKGSADYVNRLNDPALGYDEVW